MSCEFYNERIVSKPRKVYQCVGCCKKLPLNRKQYYVSGKFEGEFFGSRLCFACRKHLKNYSKNFEEGYSWGDIKEDRRETINQWKWNRRW